MGSDVAQMVLRISKAVDKGSLGTLSKAASQAEAIQQKEIAKASGGDSKLSGVGRAKSAAKAAAGKDVGNIAIDVVQRVTKTGGSPEIVLSVKGPLPLIENDTPGRVIRSAYATGAGRRARKSKKHGQLSQMAGPGLSFGGGRSAILEIPGIGVRRSARHPGTKGKYPWRIGRKKAEPAIAKTMRSRTFNVVKGAAKP